MPYLPMMSVLMSTDPLASMDSAASLATSDTSLTRRPLLNSLGQTDGVLLPARLGVTMARTPLRPGPPASDLTERRALARLTEGDPPDRWLTTAILIPPDSSSTFLLLTMTDVSVSYFFFPISMDLQLCAPES